MILKLIMGTVLVSTLSVGCTFNLDDVAEDLACTLAKEELETAKKTGSDTTALQKGVEEKC